MGQKKTRTPVPIELTSPVSTPLPVELLPPKPRVKEPHPTTSTSFTPTYTGPSTAEINARIARDQMQQRIKALDEIRKKLIATYATGSTFEGFKGAINAAFEADRAGLVKAWESNSLEGVRAYQPLLRRIEAFASLHKQAIKLLEKYKGTNKYWEARTELGKMFEEFVKAKPSEVTYQKILEAYQTFINKYKTRPQPIPQ